VVAQLEVDQLELAQPKVARTISGLVVGDLVEAARTISGLVVEDLVEAADLVVEMCYIVYK
jgi:hypothetical protein